MATGPLYLTDPRVGLEICLDSLNKTDENRLCKVIIDVLEEGERAERKHGNPSPNPLRSACIVGEEAGEVMEAALKATAIDPAEKEGQTELYWVAEMRKELIQTASSAIRRVFLIDSGEMTQWILDNPTQL